MTKTTKTIYAFCCDNRQAMALFTSAAQMLKDNKDFLGARFRSNADVPQNISAELMDSLFGEGNWAVQNLASPERHISLPTTSVKNWVRDLQEKSTPSLFERLRDGYNNQFRPFTHKKALRKITREVDENNKLIHPRQGALVVDVVRDVIPDRGRLQPKDFYMASKIVGAITPRNACEERRQDSIYHRLLFLTQVAMFDDLCAYGASAYLAGEGNINIRSVARILNSIKQGKKNHCLVLGNIHKLNSSNKYRRAREDKEPVE